MVNVLSSKLWTLHIQLLCIFILFVISVKKKGRPALDAFFLDSPLQPQTKHYWTQTPHPLFSPAGRLTETGCLLMPTPNCDALECSGYPRLAKRPARVGDKVFGACSARDPHTLYRRACREVACCLGHEIDR